MRMAFPFAMVVRLFIVVALGVACVSAGRRELRALAVPEVPEVMKVPAGYELQVTLFGEGHQYYRYNGSSWVQFSAKARLFDAQGKEIGHHFYLPHPDALGGEPSWATLTSKGVPYSAVTAKALVKTTPDPKNIPWILLQTTTARGAKEFFGDVAYVQRYNTWKGVAPSSASGAVVGRVRRSSYSAYYAFFVKA